MNSDSSSTSDSGPAKPMTRRDFVRKSAFSTGSLVTAGLILAHGEAGAVQTTTTTTTTTYLHVCDSWVFSFLTAYTDDINGNGPYFQLGRCLCLSSVAHAHWSHKEMDPQPASGRYISPGDKEQYAFKHTTDHHSFTTTPPPQPE